MKQTRKKQIVKRFILDGSEAIIRRPQKSDLKDILKVLREWYREREANGDKKKRRNPKDENWWLSRIVAPQKNQAVTLVLEIDGKAIGMVDIKKNTHPASHTAILSIIFVAKKYRHKGFGEVFLKTAVSEAKKVLKIKLIILETDEDNTHAIRLYHNCGFQRAGFIKGARLSCGKYVGRLTMVKYFYK